MATDEKQPAGWTRDITTATGETTPTTNYSQQQQQQRTQRILNPDCLLFVRLILVIVMARSDAAAETADQ